MKTLTFRFFTFGLILITIPRIWAYNFEVEGIKYEIRSTNTVCALSADNYLSNDIVIPEEVSYDGKNYSVKTIGSSFSGGDYSWGNTYIKGPTKTLFIPKSVSRIEEEEDYGIFHEFENITYITVDAENDNYASIDGVLYSKDLSVLLCYPKCNTQIKFEIPDGVEEVYESAFMNSMFLKSVVLPNSLKFLRQRGFSHCEFLEEVSWSKKLEIIERDVFYSTSISKAILPVTLRELYGYAFDSFTTMEIYCRGDKPAGIYPYKGTYQPFNDETLKYGTLYVPKNSFKFYSTAPYWRDFKNIVEYEVPQDEDPTNSTCSIIIDNYNNKTRKILKDGQIVILKKGKIYNLEGID